jgi:hypothetical protein
MFSRLLWRRWRWRGSLTVRDGFRRSGSFAGCKGSVELVARQLPISVRVRLCEAPGDDRMLLTLLGAEHAVVVGVERIEWIRSGRVLGQCSRRDKGKRQQRRCSQMTKWFHDLASIGSGACHSPEQLRCPERLLCIWIATRCRFLRARESGDCGSASIRRRLLGDGVNAKQLHGPPAVDVGCSPRNVHVFGCVPGMSDKRRCGWADSMKPMLR